MLIAFRKDIPWFNIFRTSQGGMDILKKSIVLILYREGQDDDHGFYF